MRALAAALVLTAAAACTGEPEGTPPLPSRIEGHLLYATGRDVRLALPDSQVQVIAEQQPDVDECAWSGDGRYAAWTAQVAGGRSALFVYELATGRTGTWADPRALTAGVAGTATGFVGVYRAPGKPPELIVTDPAQVLAGGQPRVVPLPLRAGELVTAVGRRVLVEQPERGAAFTGGPSTVYDVTPDGRVTPLFTNTRDLPVGAAALTADGERLVYATGKRTADPDRTDEYLVVRDLVARRELDVPTPTVPGAASSTPLSVVTGADGRTVATVSFRAADGEELANVAYVLDGDAWRQVADHAEWAATGPTGKLAVKSDGDEARLSVEGLNFSGRVECAAWAP